MGPVLSQGEQWEGVLTWKLTCGWEAPRRRRGTRDTERHTYQDGHVRPSILCAYPCERCQIASAQTNWNSPVELQRQVTCTCETTKLDTEKMADNRRKGRSACTQSHEAVTSAWGLGDPGVCRLCSRRGLGRPHTTPARPWAIDYLQRPVDVLHTVELEGDDLPAVVLAQQVVGHHDTRQGARRRHRRADQHAWRCDMVEQ